MKTSDLLTRAVAKVIPQTFAEEKLATGNAIRLYWGIDPTGAKIHLGHAVPLRKMQAFAEAGHEVIMLIGSFTAMIGDPSGRDAMRAVLTPEDVKKNFEDYKDQASKILDFSKIKVRYNHEWLEKLGFKEIIDLASNFTVQQMLQRDMFERRLKEEKFIHVHEFLYPLMVGYDSVVLDVDCEIGGTDQEFNMLAGRTLQKAFGKREKFVLTMKLLEGTDGRKMSKTYENCIYLTDEPKDMFGKVMSVKDELIAAYFECATDVPMEEIKEMEKAMKKGENPVTFKKRLAQEIVSLYHGAKEAEGAAAGFASTFAKQGIPEDIETIESERKLLVDILAEHKLVSSKSDAKRLIEQGGIHLLKGDVTLEQVIKGEYPKGKTEVTLKIGKKAFVRIRIK
jgi:tyrosyl-tRNA synthetase